MDKLKIKEICHEIGIIKDTCHLPTKLQFEKVDFEKEFIACKIDDERTYLVTNATQISLLIGYIKGANERFERQSVKTAVKKHLVAIPELVEGDNERAVSQFRWRNKRSRI